MHYCTVLLHYCAVCVSSGCAQIVIIWLSINSNYFDTVPASAPEGAPGQLLHGWLTGPAPLSLGSPGNSPTVVAAGPAAGGSPSLWPPAPKRPWAGSHGAPTSPTPRPMPPLVVDLLSLVPERGLDAEGPLCPLQLSSPMPRRRLCLVFPGSLTGIPTGSIPVPSPGFPPALSRFPHRGSHRLQSGSLTGVPAGSRPVPSPGFPLAPRSLCRHVPSYLTGGSSWPSLWAPPRSFCRLPRQFRHSSPAARLSPPPLLPAWLQPVRPMAKVPCGGPVPLPGFLLGSTSSRRVPPLPSGPRFISPERRLSLTSLRPSRMKAQLTSHAGGSPACMPPLLPSPAEHT
ncbi:uncharacterized protein LOC109285970 isoform X1 [Alligator mississippiensis]|uniref:uncharacterized protein LOC109285970 isoform X1 n=1 Tax=Alligator mississippiensis TaxID=8496 RepID=UPI002877A16A|nr:uncharacterized protein LOC109285970 isoform X1 [Alligator mississippiensis]XP_059579939.1 uncharacterized protein LOC109285970 isoform X1 [Alligator mississippiensis]XP_059579940.1 uncharacterized protein LOC109285970 isoform X1 [Alligator mississippiensis]